MYSCYLTNHSLLAKITLRGFGYKTCVREKWLNYLTFIHDFLRYPAKVDRSLVVSLHMIWRIVDILILIWLQGRTTRTQRCSTFPSTQWNDLLPSTWRPIFHYLVTHSTWSLRLFNNRWVLIEWKMICIVLFWWSQHTKDRGKLKPKNIKSKLASICL